MIVIVFAATMPENPTEARMTTVETMNDLLVPLKWVNKEKRSLLMIERALSDLQNNITKQVSEVYPNHSLTLQNVQVKAPMMFDETINEMKNKPKLIAKQTELGRGSFGRVVLEGENPPIAVKLMHVNAFERFEHECKVLKEIGHHPNIVRYYEPGIEQQLKQSGLHIRMEYCEHGDLKRVIEDPCMVYTMNTVVTWSKQLFSALVHLEHHKIIHRDIKAANVMVDDKFILKLGDFGCAEVMDNFPFCLAGTNRYMSPECVLETDENLQIVNFYKSDLYGVGLIMWELIERRTVFLEYGSYFDQCAFLIDFQAGCLKTEAPQCEITLQSLQRECVKFIPKQRPNAQEAWNRLASIQKNYESYKFVPDIRVGNKRLLRPLGYNLTNEENDIFANSQGSKNRSTTNRSNNAMRGGQTNSSRHSQDKVTII